MEKLTQPCPLCGGLMVSEKGEHTVKYKRASQAITSHGWWCDDCGEVFLDGPDSLQCIEIMEQLKQQVEATHAPLNSSSSVPTSL